MTFNKRLEKEMKFSWALTKCAGHWRVYHTNSNDKPYVCGKTPLQAIKLAQKENWI